ncbi:hypothetical protein J2J97_32385 (plasmid) [Rhizobium bangladeshense]|uniref:hypothetical protein n=1 Tax=Rhizobium bangladeshense TaxID=1138189 RepID=UPI001A988917|nr:hypothetical protein [Rhizobium bangladeshense]QSY98604.1 hypothetical protein J2J97_32385 [Rhizobium bangladeshense]
MQTKVYDPRDPTQNVDDPATWKETNNPALHAAHYARQMAHSLAPLADTFWKGVEASANYCDQPVRAR